MMHGNSNIKLLNTCDCHVNFLNIFSLVVKACYTPVLPHSHQID